MAHTTIRAPALLAPSWSSRRRASRRRTRVARWRSGRAIPFSASPPSPAVSVRCRDHSAAW